MIISTDASNIHVTPMRERVSRAAIEQLAAYPVALIGDTQERIGMLDGRITPYTSAPVMFGSVLPVMSRAGDNLAVHRALDEARPGDVLVINAEGALDRAVVGGIIVEACLEIGIAGLVIDGAVRDAADLETLGLPTYARGATPAGPYKNGPGTVGTAVACGGIVCNPGDVIIADRDGAIVLDPRRIEDTLALVEKQTDVEAGMRGRIASAFSTRQS